MFIYMTSSKILCLANLVIIIDTVKSKSLLGSKILNYKIAPRLLLYLSTVILFSGIYVPLKAQQNDPAVSVSAESIATAKKLSQQGQAKAEIMDYKGAIADLSQAIELNPNEADFYYQRGLILGKLSDRQSAVQDFDDAIARDPNHAWAYLQRGGLSFDLGSSFQITDYRGFNYNLDRLTGDRRGDARAILDLRKARDLFARQGNRQGYQTADSLIKHFVGEAK